MKPTFSPYEDDFGAELKCPACGDNYLHHERIEVFQRPEDAETGIHVDIEKLSARVDDNLNSTLKHSLLHKDSRLNNATCIVLECLYCLRHKFRLRNNRSNRALDLTCHGLLNPFLSLFHKAR